MKCKKGFKKSDGKCEKVKNINTIKTKKMKNKWMTIVLFSVLSLVLFVNNLTDFFVKFDLYLPVQWVTWIGIVLVVLYNSWLSWEGRL